MIREYHTRAPFTQISWKKAGGTWVPLLFPHPVGYAIPKEFTECLVPMQWWEFSRYHYIWSYVHNATRDYTVIARLGFEDVEPDWFVCKPDGTKCFNPVGDPTLPGEPDCQNPVLIVEYTRNRLKNGFFAFRRFLNERPEYDLPLYWEVEVEGNVSVNLTDKATYQGPFSLYIGKSGEGRGVVYQKVDVLPDTEHVCSVYYTGTVPENAFEFAVSAYDVSGNLLETFSSLIPAGSYRTDGWEWHDIEIRFRTPHETSYVTVELRALPGEMYGYACFSSVWLSECPVNVYPYYRISAQIESYKGDRMVDIWEGLNDTRIWTGITSDNVPRNVFEIYVSSDGAPCFRSAVRHEVQNAVFYYMHSSMHPEWRERADTLQAWRDKYGYTYDLYHPLWRESDTYPDGFMFSMETFHDCDAWFMAPSRTFYPYWSKVCLCRDAAIIGLATRNPYFPSLLAVHLMNKYNDPFIKVRDGYYGGPAVGFIPVSAYSLLFEGISYPVLAVPPVKDSIDPDRGWPRGSGVYSIYSAACALAAFAEIGYGFYDLMVQKGYGSDAELARNYADRLAITLLKNQWGYPFQKGKTGYFRHEDYGEVNLPEAAGGFLVLTIYKKEEKKEGVPLSLSSSTEEEVPYATSRKDWLTEFTDMFNMPPETPGIIPANMETTLICMRALQIYEWYKYKGGKGPFPKLLIPADIDGDGWVSPIDLARVKLCVTENFYDPLCDINLDGKVDSEDLNLVNAHLGRGTPRSGTLWMPTLARTSVEIKEGIQV
jgi:hypothetical protein